MTYDDLSAFLAKKERSEACRALSGYEILTRERTLCMFFMYVTLLCLMFVLHFYGFLWALAGVIPAGAIILLLFLKKRKMEAFILLYAARGFTELPKKGGE